MSDARNLPDVNFVSTDVSSLENAMISAYERMTGKTLYPGSPERIFVLWATDIVVQLRVLINESARQNVPSSSNGAYL
ncbi:MAG: phage baseplate protein, partial [Oscillospiraceae bacterium]